MVRDIQGLCYLKKKVERERETFEEFLDQNRDKKAELKERKKLFRH